MSEAAALPFLDSVGRPDVRGILPHQPVSGEIVDTFVWEGLSLVQYVAVPKGPATWWIQTPGPADIVKLKRIQLDGQHLMGETVPFARFEVARHLHPLVQAEGYCMKVGEEAADESKGLVPFAVFWADKTEFSGVLTLDRQGRDHGRTFQQSLRRRMMFYCGLMCPRDAEPEDFFAVMKHVKEAAPDRVRLAFHILGRCEL